MSRKLFPIILLLVILVMSISATSAEDISSDNYTNIEDNHPKSMEDIGIQNTQNNETIENIIWVSPDGTGNGTSDNDSCNFEYAMNNLKENSVIYLLDGTYNLNKKYTIELDNIIIQSVNQNNVFFNKISSFGSIIVNSNNVLISGIIISAPIPKESTGIIITWNGENGTVNNCKFINLSAPSGSAIFANKNAINLKIFDSEFIDTVDAVYIIAPNFIIDGCNFNEGNRNTSYSEGGAIQVESVNGTISNCKFENNHAHWWGEQYIIETL